MAAIKVPLTFRIFKGDQFLREERLSLSAIKLGKVPSAHVRLDDETVSRMHAIVEVNGPDDVSIIDLGSTKGTFVNGQRINKAKLQSGDVIVVGETKIEIAARETAAAPAVVAPPPIPKPTVPMAPVAHPAPAAVAHAIAPVPAPAFQLAMASEADDHGGAPAVEVAAMFGDSVVGVKHCIDPKGGKITAATWLLFAVGIASLLAFVVAFYVAVDNAAFNKGALSYWTTKEHKPAYAYRPRELAQGMDWLAFGGLACAIVTTASALARMRKEKQSSVVRIGTAPGVEFPLEQAPSPDFALVSPHGNDFAVHLAHGMEGEVTVGGKSTAIADLLAAGRSTISPLPQGAKVRARLGRSTFMISAVAAPRRHVAPLFAALESRVLAYFAGSLAAHLGIWVLLQQIPVEESAANLELSSLEDIETKANIQSRDDAPPPKTEDDGASDNPGGSGTAMALADGKMGSKDSERAAGRYAMLQTQDTPQLSREQAIEEARKSGVLGNVAIVQGGAFTSLTAASDLSSGFDDRDVYGGLMGTEVGEMNGGFGYGHWGFGPGAGGKGWGTIGTGDFGTIGQGSGAGTGYSVGNGEGGMRKHTSSTPTVTIGQPVPSGDLDRSIIRRYILRNLEKIQYCYEKALLSKPSLAGTVQVQFFITPTGNVATSHADGVDPEVSNCVADVIHQVEFPRPKGGGGVQVNYPFTFHSAGH